MLRPSLCDYNHAHILMSESITIDGARADDAEEQLGEINKGLIIKNYAPFFDCISEMNNTQIDHEKYFGAVILMYNLIECSKAYSKTSGILWQYYRDEPAAVIVKCKSFKSKIRMTRKTPANGNSKDGKIAVPLKCLSNFRITPEITLTNCEASVNLTLCEDCGISSATGETKFAVADKKLYIVILSTQDNVKY